MGRLAEYSMQGRLQALLVVGVAVLTLFFFWVGAAVLALVTLRRGVSEGLVLLLWSLLPAAVVLFYGDGYATVAVLLGSFVTASVLRTSVSWQTTLVAASGSGVFAGIALMLLAGDYLAAQEALVADIVGQVQEQWAAQGETLAFQPPDALFLAGAFGLVTALLSAACVALGRYWQALLYNPGGFREEFHHIRLAPALAVALVGVNLLCWVQSSLLPWGYLATVPCLFAGISLVHGLAAIKQLKNHWLVLFYMMLLLFGPAMELVIIAAVLDSFIDFRKRVASGVS